MTVATLEEQAGFEFFAYQTEAIEAAGMMTAAAARLCLYYKTGAGKTVRWKDIDISSPAVKKSGPARL